VRREPPGASYARNRTLVVDILCFTAAVIELGQSRIQTHSGKRFEVLKK
jgi:hypothetical protein